MDDNRCKNCGALINLDDFEPNLEIPQFMAKKHVCYKCAFWFKRREWDKELISKKGLQGPIPVITPDWSHWIVKPFQKLAVETGTYSRTIIESTRTYMAVIDERDSERVWFIDTNNASHQGIIPEHLRGLFTPNGVVLSPMEWKCFQDRKSITSADIKEIIQINRLFK